MNQHQNLDPKKLLENCREFLNDLRKANDANSFGNTLFRALRPKDLGDKSNADDSHESLVDKAFDKHKRFLQHVGLEVYYADGIAADSPVRINDPEKFLHFFLESCQT